MNGYGTKLPEETVLLRTSRKDAIRGIIQNFYNWPSILLRRVITAYTGIDLPLTFCSRSGITILGLPRDRTWGGVLDFFVDDVDNLSELSCHELHTIVDIGANIGTFSLACAERFPTSKIFCYEPVPHTYIQLERNVSINGLAKRISTHNAAVVGAEDIDTVQIWTRRGHSANSSLCGGLNTAESLGQWTEVPAMSLHSIISSIDSTIDLLKVDVEGAEYEIFRNTSIAALERGRFAVVEYHPLAGHSHREIVAVFQRAKYIWYRHERHHTIAGAGTLWFEHK